METTLSQSFWTPLRGSVGQPNYKLNAQEKADKDSKVKAYIRRFFLDTSGRVKITRTKRGGKKGPQPADRSTLSDYLLYIRQIGDFAYRIGDFRTCTICDRDLCPKNPHPANPETLILFFKWKSGEHGSTLKDLSGNDVKDIQDRTILCTGDYHTPQCLNKCDGAIKTLHDAYETCRGTYQHPCTECLDANGLQDIPATYLSTNFHSCSDHANNPRIALFGDPTLSDTCKTHHEEIRKMLKAAHIVRGNTQLSPAMVRNLHSQLSTTGDIHDFQAWVMILMGMCLMLRADELITMKIEDFEMDFNIVHPDSVRNVAVCVQGKCDAAPQLLSIWKNDEFVELCPIRALFCYLKVTGIRAGFLFPNRKFLIALMMNRATPIGDQSERHKYSSWLTRMKRLMTKSFPHMFGKKSKKCCIVGTHTLRKTGYLFAVWGVLRAMNAQFGGVRTKDFKPNLLFEDILRCARHKSVGMAQNYVLDAISRHERVQEERFVANQVVSVWKSFKIDELAHAGDINGASLPYIQATLPLQADWWYTVELNNYRGNHLGQMYAAACVKKDSVETEGRLMALIEKLGEEDRKEARWLIGNLQRETTDAVTKRYISAQSQIPGSAVSTAGGLSSSGRGLSRSGATPTSTTTDSNETQEPPRKRQKRGEKDYKEQRDQASALEKAYKRKPSLEGGRKVLKAWDDFYKTVEDEGGYCTLKDGAPRKYYSNRRTNKTAIERCITGCFGGREEAFFGQLRVFPTVYGKIYTCNHNNT